MCAIKNIICVLLCQQFGVRIQISEIEILSHLDYWNRRLIMILVSGNVVSKYSFIWKILRLSEFFVRSICLLTRTIGNIFLSQTEIRQRN